ncbi:MAG: hypothetical protein B7Z37_08795 [Verrucomicrobia bacterium 12-59-8]|nr:MAG: hypothetical protein B7Z37_08795 [Verrucomicrobia bacterium 12-59-8]
MTSDWIVSTLHVDQRIACARGQRGVMAQMNEAKAAAVNYKEDFSSDGCPQGPFPEMVAKLSRVRIS